MEGLKAVALSWGHLRMGLQEGGGDEGNPVCQEKGPLATQHGARRAGVGSPLLAEGLLPAAQRITAPEGCPDPPLACSHRDWTAGFCVGCGMSAASWHQSGTSGAWWA